MSLKSDKRGRKSIFRCFRPRVNDDEDGQESRSRVKKTFISSKLRRAASLPPPSPALIDDSRSVKKNRRGFSARFRAAFSDSSMFKKSWNSKRSQNSDALVAGSSYSESNCGSGIRANSSSGLTSSVSLDSSSLSSLLSSSWSTQSPGIAMSLSSSSRALISSQRQFSFEKQQQNHKLRVGYRGSSLRVLLVTLLTMVVWGKIFSIICTSGMLYITSCHKRTVSGSGSKRGNHICDAIDSPEYRKRIILSGLLDRKRSSSFGKTDQRLIEADRR